MHTCFDCRLWINLKKNITEFLNKTNELFCVLLRYWLNAYNSIWIILQWLLRICLTLNMVHVSIHILQYVQNNLFKYHSVLWMYTIDDYTSNEMIYSSTWRWSSLVPDQYLADNNSEQTHSSVHIKIVFIGKLLPIN